MSRGVLRAATSVVVVPRRPRSAPVAAPAPAAPEQDAVRADAVPPHGTHLRQRPAPPPQPRAVNFSDAREAFRSKTSGELLRGLLVLRLCALEPLVQRAEQVSEDPAGLAGKAERRRGKGGSEPLPAAPCLHPRRQIYLKRGRVFCLKLGCCFGRESSKEKKDMIDRLLMLLNPRPVFP